MSQIPHNSVRVQHFPEDLDNSAAAVISRVESSQNSDGKSLVSNSKLRLHQIISDSTSDDDDGSSISSKVMFKDTNFAGNVISQENLDGRVTNKHYKQLDVNPVLSTIANPVLNIVSPESEFSLLSPGQVSKLLAFGDENYTAIAEMTKSFTPLERPQSQYSLRSIDGAQKWAEFLDDRLNVDEERMESLVRFASVSRAEQVVATSVDLNEEIISHLQLSDEAKEKLKTLLDEDILGIDGISIATCQKCGRKKAFYYCKTCNRKHFYHHHHYHGKSFAKKVSRKERWGGRKKEKSVVFDVGDSELKEDCSTEDHLDVVGGNGEIAALGKEEVKSECHDDTEEEAHKEESCVTEEAEEVQEKGKEVQKEAQKAEKEAQNEADQEAQKDLETPNNSPLSNPDQNNVYVKGSSKLRETVKSFSESLSAKLYAHYSPLKQDNDFLLGNESQPFPFIKPVRTEAPTVMLSQAIEQYEGAQEPNSLDEMTGEDSPGKRRRMLSHLKRPLHKIRAIYG